MEIVIGHVLFFTAMYFFMDRKGEVHFGRFTGMLSRQTIVRLEEDKEE